MSASRAPYRTRVSPLPILRRYCSLHVADAAVALTCADVLLPFAYCQMFVLRFGSCSLSHP